MDPPHGFQLVNRGQHVAILMQRRARPLELELSAALVEVLHHRTGRNVPVRRDGDAEALDADVLLLISDCATYEALPRQIGRVTQKPRVILWQMHPLPPACLEPRAEKMGLAATRLCQRLGRFAYQLALALPERHRRRCQAEAVKSLEAPLYRLVARRVRSQPDWPWPDVDWRCVSAMMRRVAWLESARRDGWLGRIAATTPQAAAYLRQRGFETVFAPLGSHPALGANLGHPRDLDAVFLGRLKLKNRVHRLMALHAALQKLGIELTIIDRDCYGPDRIALLNRAKVLVNLNKYPWDTPYLRFLLGASCGAAIVSEPLEGVSDSPWRAGEHFVSADGDAMADEVARLVRDVEARLALVERAQQLIEQTLTMEVSLARVLAMSPVDTEPSRAMKECAA